MSYPDTPAIESQDRLIAMLLDESAASKFDTAEGETTIVNISVVVPISGAVSVAV